MQYRVRHAVAVRAAKLENVGIDLARPGTGDNVRQTMLLLSFLFYAAAIHTRYRQCVP